MRRVKVTGLPYIPPGPKFKASYPNNKNVWPLLEINSLRQPDIGVNTTLKPVPREHANLEAEKGETAYGDINGDTIPEHFNIGGKKHYNGGTPLSLPDNSFIFSNDKNLKISNPTILKEFGKSVTKKFTPAEIAKQYDINNYRKFLQDPNSDELQRKTAEKMIANYNMKLGKLALVQESKKGFPNGIPQVAMPYVTTNNVNPQELVFGKNKQQPESQPEQSKTGGEKKKRVKVVFPGPNFYQMGGPLMQAPTALVPNVTNSPLEGSVAGAVNAPKSLTGDPKFDASFSSLTSMLQDPNNQDLRDGIYQDYKSKMPDSKLSEDEVINNFINFQRQVHVIQGHRGKDTDFMTSKDWDKGGNRANSVYTSTATSLGLTPMTSDQIKSAQATYQSIYDLSSDDKYKDYLGGFDFGKGALAQVGVGDQTYKGASISPIDGIFGNTTVGQIVLAKTPPAQTQPEQIQQPAKDKVDDYYQAPIPPEQPVPPSQWWMQDIVGTAGAAADMARIKKYMPWSSPMEAFLPTTTFYDPTRELAANAEQASIAQQAAAMFAGPQAYSARAQATQAQAATNAADIMSRYNNLNVGVANQAALQNSQIQQQTAGFNQQQSQDLYDKTMIVNQNFDNAKAMARQQLRQGFMDAITNRANAQVLNQLYPQYNISPITGGMMHFTHGRPLQPTYPSNSTIADLAGDYVKQHPGLDWNTAFSMAKVSQGIQDNPGYGYVPDQQYMQAYQQMLPQRGQ